MGLDLAFDTAFRDVAFRREFRRITPDNLGRWTTGFEFVGGSGLPKTGSALIGKPIRANPF